MSDFFNTPKDQSTVKSTLVKKYFLSWAKIMNSKSNGDRLGYIDLFSGPGIYDDGYESTPIQVTKLILSDINFRQKFVLFFNDKNEKNINNLKKALSEMDNFENLKHSPIITCSEVDEEFSKKFMEMSLIPSFVFIDPFGYKGVTIDLIRSLTKDWGCDCILFFNYNRINSGISNSLVSKHMKALFGDIRYNELNDIIKNDPYISREEVILNQFSLSMKDIGIEYVLPFRFEYNNRKCTSHYLIFLTKNNIGYKIMKEIMSNESINESIYEENEVGTFEFIPSSSKQLSFLNNFEHSIPKLKEDLLRCFSKKQLNVKRIYTLHNKDTPYILRNYKSALLELEEEGKITADPAIRTIRKGKKTMADHVKIIFP